MPRQSVFWSPNYVQTQRTHRARSRTVLFNLIKSMPPQFKHEHEQGSGGRRVRDRAQSLSRASGRPKNWICRGLRARWSMESLSRHWDVVEDESVAGRIEERVGRLFGDLAFLPKQTTGGRERKRLAAPARRAGSTHKEYTIERNPMNSVITKHSISSELAQKMVDGSGGESQRIGRVSENVTILDDGGQSQGPFSRNGRGIDPHH